MHLETETLTLTLKPNTSVTIVNDELIVYNCIFDNKNYCNLLLVIQLSLFFVPFTIVCLQ